MGKALHLVCGGQAIVPGRQLLRIMLLSAAGWIMGLQALPQPDGASGRTECLMLVFVAAFKLCVVRVCVAVAGPARVHVRQQVTRHVVNDDHDEDAKDDAAGPNWVVNQVFQFGIALRDDVDERQRKNHAGGERAEQHGRRFGRIP
eukprot:352470-Chlamydomonas_euryale.AAC.11